MNKVYPLLLSLLIGVAAMAADRPRGGILTISTADNSAIRVSIDGRNFNSRDNSFTLSNVEPGYHEVQVFRMNNARNLFDIFGRNREQLIFNNSIYMKPLYQVDVVINRNGRARVNEFDISRNQRNGGWYGNGNNGQRDGDDNDRDDHGNRNNGYDNHDNRNNGGYDNRNNNGGYDNRDYRNEGGYDNRNSGGYDNRGNRNGGYNGTLSYQEFQSMKETLRREGFENSRLILARQLFDRNNFKSDQVRELLQLFSFENNRLDLAKFAYRNTVDKNNYSMVFDVFSQYSNRQELAGYISNYQ